MASYTKLALIVFCTGALVGLGAGPEREKPTPLERLFSKDIIEIKMAQDELIAVRKDLIARLIDIIKVKENRLRNQASVKAAIFILGEMRALEAIEVLVDHIGFPDVYEGKPLTVNIEARMLHRGIKNIGEVYPAAEGLIKIGEPCLDPVIIKLTSSVSATEQKACLAVLVGLRHQDFVIHMLKEAVNKETDTKKRDRLQNSLDLLSQIER